MFSVLPAVVASLYLAFAFHVVLERGLRQANRTFVLLCVLTGLWQLSWACLFLVDDRQTAYAIARLGYMPILFLPTALYQFHATVHRRNGDERGIQFAWFVSAALALANLCGDSIVRDVQWHPWGWYPQAGWLHPVHMLQTAVLVARSLVISIARLRSAAPEHRTSARLSAASLGIFSLAAVDYLCNYGAPFYPPGFAFIAAALALLSVAVSRHRLIDEVRSAIAQLANGDMAIRTTLATAATMAHEMRNALAAIRMTCSTIENRLERGMAKEQILTDIDRLNDHIEAAKLVIDLTLASCRMDRIDTSTFGTQSMSDTLDEALDTYPFLAHEHRQLSVRVVGDFFYRGSKPLFIFVLFNLLKNAFQATAAAEPRAGSVQVRLLADGVIEIEDNGCGIAPEHRPRVFDAFFSTKASSGLGIGLAFCKRVVDSFSGTIECESVEQQFTRFRIRLPLA